MTFHYNIKISLANSNFNTTRNKIFNTTTNDTGTFWMGTFWMPMPTWNVLTMDVGRFGWWDILTRGDVLTNNTRTFWQKQTGTFWQVGRFDRLPYVLPWQLLSKHSGNVTKCTWLLLCVWAIVKIEQLVIQTAFCWQSIMAQEQQPFLCSESFLLHQESSTLASNQQFQVESGAAMNDIDSCGQQWKCHLSLTQLHRLQLVLEDF